MGGSGGGHAWRFKVVFAWLKRGCAGAVGVGCAVVVLGLGGLLSLAHPCPATTHTHTHTCAGRFLSGEIRGQLGIQEDGLYLYRNILPPRFQGLAFVGAEVATFNNILTGGLQAQWLKRALLGKVKVPER